MFKWNLLYFNLHLLPLALSLSIAEKICGVSLSQVFIHAGKIPWTCSAPGWKIPTLSASSMSDAAAPSPPLWTCAGLIPAHPRLSGTARPQHRIPDVFQQGWAEGKRSPSLACWQCSVWYSPEAPGPLCCRWLLLPHGQSVHQDAQCLTSPELPWGQLPIPASVWGYPATCRQCELAKNGRIKKLAAWDSQKSARPDWRLSPVSLWLMVEHLPKEWEARIRL